MKEMADYGALPHKLQEIIKRCNTKGRSELSLHVNSQRPPKEVVGKTASLFASIRECAKELGYEIPLTSTGGVCDGNTLAAFGLPVIDTLGPKGENLHTFEECVYLNTLAPRARLCTLFLLKLAAGEISPP
jgi:glutamate carboxypeptidase